MKRPGIRGLVLSLVVVAGGCAAPAPLPPAASPPAAMAPMLGDWWRLYDDRTLDAFIAESLAAGPDARIAAANLRKSQALARQSLAARYPGTEVRAALSVDESTPDPSGTTDTYTSELRLGYEFDVAGRRSADIAAALADAEASAAAFDAVRVALVAETLQAYVDACAAGAQIAAAEQALALQRQTAERVGRRVAAGATAGLDASLADGAAAQTGAALPALQASRSDALLRLAALRGQPPSDAAIATFDCTRAPALQAERLPSGEGMALIARRPDLRQHEGLARAALARLGVAQADLYPRVSLGLAAGAGGETWNAIGFKWSLTPLISWTFPNRQAVRSKIGQAEAESDAAYARWDRVVLLALRDVESALQRCARELDRSAELQRARQAYAAAARRAEARYRLGGDSVLGLLEAQRRLAEIDGQLAQAQGRIAGEQVRLFVALGGSWTAAARAARATPAGTE